ncbi:DUF2063 domain-containing protein [Salipiger marinus]|uniref:HvfC/BufC N-terminal domain-containing protein n=1 Tax=Salipiger marinus TaxID=555512 RepID=UPI001E625898|nr:DNA-binding domain-containing protein [Salipiger manganoxidans]MCD1616444.1 putative DNA-binding domain-containing protein [Salipiger manganoxidans]MEB3419716.1 DNA-binding domain-containing protein [Salipiger manganoxidans]
MPAHPEFLARFDAALRGGALPPGVTARAPAEAERRFAVYRNNVTVSLTAALAARFPVIARLVGPAFFAALARHFAETHRPQSPVTAEWGAEFPEFLEGFPPLAAYPYMGDVARIEHARGRAFHAADAAPLHPARLAGADPETLRLGLHPSLILLRLAHPAVSIWARNQPGGADLPLARGPQIALILRDPGYEVQLRAVTAGEAALIEALVQGQPLAEAAARAHAADPGFDPARTLPELMRHGALVDAKV